MTDTIAGINDAVIKEKKKKKRKKRTKKKKKRTKRTKKRRVKISSSMIITMRKK